MRTISLLLVLVCSTAFAQLEVTVKKARSVITAQTTEVMRLETEDGIAIGREVTRELDPVVRPGQPAAIIIVKPDRPADQVELIKLKCETAEVHPIADAPGYFGISKPGKHTVSVNVFGKNPFTWDDKTILVEVGHGPNPPPPGPDPPGPTPGPSPIDGQGLRVLFVVESSEANLLTSGQQQVLYGEQVRSYLNQYCAKGTDSKQTPEWRIMDPDSKFTAADNKFAKALARPRASLPWIVISNGTSGYEGPLPASPEEAVFLIDQYNTAKTGGANR